MAVNPPHDPTAEEFAIDALRTQLKMRDRTIDELRKELEATRSRLDAAVAQNTRSTARVKLVEARLDEIRSICDRIGS